MENGPAQGAGILRPYTRGQAYAQHTQEKEGISMQISLDNQILIIRAAMDMLEDLHNFAPRAVFPHGKRTGLTESQVFELMAGLDPLIPYYIKDYHTATTADEHGGWNWTFLLEYTSTDREAIRRQQEETAEAVHFLAPNLFLSKMPDYVKVYRACSFLAASASSAGEISAVPYIHSPYGALIQRRCSSQGYAQALALLLGEAGIPCVLVGGFALKENGSYADSRVEYDARTRAARHYWNMVGLETTDGVKYFHIDLCWDIRDGALSLQYFLKDDYYMRRTLKWDEDAYPSCPVLPGGDVRSLVKGWE